ncbi:response regulator [Sedimenticola thiotaurini]|uniref:response regulator n=1 Tax=Sedimenticola thiotaurini TaxID=1543721 RepID=UPI0018FF416B|nr:response regulator [Sedimenticola thiotaurini]
MSESGRILVIDDEISIRESLCAFLEDYDYQVESAESAEEALERLRHEIFDLAIVDMRLSGMSGDIFITKAIRVLPSLRFLIHTGSVEFYLSDELKRLGIREEHVYLKPLNDLTMLAEGVRKRLDEAA